MEKDKRQQRVAHLTERLQQIDYDRLPISDYNKQYIKRLKPAMAYYLEIYANCLEKGVTEVGIAPEALTLIDYGGGSGFLSLLAKEMGVGRVIYIDLNPLSVEAIGVLTRELGVGPDTILHGDAETLAHWCYARQIKPQLLIATDLIEHVYNLEAFFNTLIGLNNQMPLIFTTASTPFHPIVKHRLHKLMQGYESGTLTTPNYFTRRARYIRQAYPLFSEEEVEWWAQHTRGLVYCDIKKAVDSAILPIPTDQYNTCDPETGNCTERILPIRSYRSYLAPHHYTLQLEKGFYNVNRKSRVASWVCRAMNFLIRRLGRAGYLFAPFIWLTCKRKREHLA